MNLKRNMQALFEQGDQTVFNIQASMAQAWLEGDKTLKLADASDIGQLWLENTSIECSVEQVLAIMALYPKVVIAINEFGFSDTEVRGSVMNALANLLTGSDWPTYGDGIDIDQYTKLLKQQAVLMNFVVKEQV